MENAVEIGLWLSAISGLSSLFFIVLLPAAKNGLEGNSWDWWLEDLSIHLVQTILKLLGCATLTGVVLLSLLNVPYWLSKKPFGWHDLPAMNVIAHDQFGSLLVLSSLGGTAVAIAFLAWLFKREYVW